MAPNQLLELNSQLRDMNVKFSHIDQFVGMIQENTKNRDEKLEQMCEDVASLRHDLVETNRKVDGLLHKITKWEGKLGGFMLVTGCMWAFFVAMKEQILDFFKG